MFVPAVRELSRTEMVYILINVPEVLLRGTQARKSAFWADFMFLKTYSAWWQPKCGSNLVLNTNFAW